MPEVVTESVIAFPGVRVGQHLVGLVDLLELVLRGRILVHIGVVLAGQLAVRLLNFVGAGALRYPEHFVVVTGHRCSPLRAADDHRGGPQLSPVLSITWAQDFDHGPGRKVGLGYHTDHFVQFRGERHTDLVVALEAES